jgi:glutamyl-tRNA synthetase
MAAQIPFTVKFSIPTGPAVRVRDVIRGDIDFDRSLIGDFVLVKSDQTPSYNFAVVVDDGMMGITDVVRGEDHISNTPKQILLFEALGYMVPKFAHLPMILGPDKSKLSKRHGATGVTEYQAQGFLADALFNYLVLLGWSSADGKELMTRDEIISRFTLERVSKSGAVFDVTKLRWMNGQYIRRQTPDELLNHVVPYLSDRVRLALDALGSDRFRSAIYSIRDNLDVLTDCNSFLEVYAMDPTSFIAQVQAYGFGETDRTVISTFRVHVLGLTEWTVSSIESAISAVVTETGLGKGKVFKPIRIATSGQPSGPHLAELIWILGQSVVVQRMADVVGLLDQKI